MLETPSNEVPEAPAQPTQLKQRSPARHFGNFGDRGKRKVLPSRCATQGAARSCPDSGDVHVASDARSGTSLQVEGGTAQVFVSHTMEPLATDVLISAPLPVRGGFWPRRRRGAGEERAPGNSACACRGCDRVHLFEGKFSCLASYLYDRKLPEAV